MTREKFDEIWQSIFIETYNELSPKEDMYFRPFAKEKVYKEYQKKKSYLKINYMQNPNTHLDRHKIAACMMYAIVKIKPVRIKPFAIWNKFIKKEKFPVEYSLLNEYMSLYTALSIIESFRVCESETKDGAEKVKRHDIRIPMTTNGENYIYNTCLDLYLSKKKKNINVLTFANVFFLLETGNFTTTEK